MSDPIDVESVRLPTPLDQALMDFGKALTTKSIDTLTDFSKIMVTLISGLFATYFALLKFVGLNVAQSLSGNLLFLAAIPPVLFILSLLVVVLGVLFPIREDITLNDLDSIKKVRQDLLDSKYRASFICIILFVAGMVTMMAAYLSLI